MFEHTDPEYKELKEKILSSWSFPEGSEQLGKQIASIAFETAIATIREYERMKKDD